MNGCSTQGHGLEVDLGGVGLNDLLKPKQCNDQFLQIDLLRK